MRYCTLASLYLALRWLVEQRDDFFKPTEESLSSLRIEISPIYIVKNGSPKERIAKERKSLRETTAVAEDEEARRSGGWMAALSSMNGNWGNGNVRRATMGYCAKVGTR